MNTNEASTCDDKVTFAWLQPLQSLVGGFAQVVVEQTADFCEWLLVVVGADLCISDKE